MGYLWNALRGRNDFIEIMEMLDKRLNDKGKNWRHVFKVPSFLIYTFTFYYFHFFDCNEASFFIFM